jgi:hypothetical protein
MFFQQKKEVSVTRSAISRDNSKGPSKGLSKSPRLSKKRVVKDSITEYSVGNASYNTQPLTAAESSRNSIIRPISTRKTQASKTRVLKAISPCQLCKLDLQILNEIDQLKRPHTAVMQVVKMLCIFLEIFRERSVHFISTAEALITWP